MPFDIKKSPKAVAVCGTGEGWQLLPKSTGRTIYCLNDFVRIEKYQVQPDVLFIMDVLSEKPQIVSGLDNLGDMVARINAMKVPLIAPFKYAEIPLSQAFPLKECVKEFGLPYFSNTICYMIAYALLQGAEEIDTYGVNQAGSMEYNLEKPAVEYWLGIAAGRGVKVTIHGDKSLLLSNRARYGGDVMYGYNQTYEQFLRTEETFAEPVVKRILEPMRPVSRTVRQVK